MNKEMVHVFYSRIDFVKFIEVFEISILDMPKELSSQCLKYINIEDRCRCLAGKLLVEKAIKHYKLNLNSYTDIYYSIPYRRPHFLNSKYDFNISHSGNYVVGIIGENTNVGIDIEHVKDIDINCFRAYFGIDEWKVINSSKNKYLTFYKEWTKKEAIIKADGRGLSILDKVQIVNNTCVLNTNTWRVKELFFDKEYVSHFVHNSLDCVPSITKFEL